MGTSTNTAVDKQSKRQHRKLVGYRLAIPELLLLLLLRGLRKDGEITGS